MRNNFQIVAIDASRFNYLFKLNKKELSKHRAIKIIADTIPGYPCRVSLEEAKIAKKLYSSHLNIIA
ncbi:MAG: hypothetical protein V3V16_06550 [Melioribacteraceae bacterium]